MAGTAGIVGMAAMPDRQNDRIAEWQKGIMAEGGIACI
jgi:hypothetical protein